MCKTLLIQYIEGYYSKVSGQIACSSLIAFDVYLAQVNSNPQQNVLLKLGMKKFKRYSENKQSISQSKTMKLPIKNKIENEKISESYQQKKFIINNQQIKKKLSTTSTAIHSAITSGIATTKFHKKEQKIKNGNSLDKKSKKSLSNSNFRLCTAISFNQNNLKSKVITQNYKHKKSVKNSNSHSKSKNKQNKITNDIKIQKKKIQHHHNKNEGNQESIPINIELNNQKQIIINNPHAIQSRGEKSQIIEVVTISNEIPKSEELDFTKQLKSIKKAIKKIEKYKYRIQKQNQLLKCNIQLIQNNVKGQPKEQCSQNQLIDNFQINNIENSYVYKQQIPLQIQGESQMLLKKRRKVNLQQQVFYKQDQNQIDCFALKQKNSRYVGQNLYSLNLQPQIDILGDRKKQQIDQPIEEQQFEYEIKWKQCQPQIQLENPFIKQMNSKGIQQYF